MDQERLFVKAAILHKLPELCSYQNLAKSIVGYAKETHVSVKFKIQLPFVETSHYNIQIHPSRSLCLIQIFGSVQSRVLVFNTGCRHHHWSLCTCIYDVQCCTFHPTLPYLVYCSHGMTTLLDVHSNYAVSSFDIQNNASYAEFHSTLPLLMLLDDIYVRIYDVTTWSLISRKELKTHIRPHFNRTEPLVEYWCIDQNLNATHWGWNVYETEACMRTTLRLSWNVSKDLKDFVPGHCHALFMNPNGSLLACHSKIQHSVAIHK